MACCHLNFGHLAVPLLARPAAALPRRVASEGFLQPDSLPGCSDVVGPTSENSLARLALGSLGLKLARVDLPEILLVNSELVARAFALLALPVYAQSNLNHSHILQMLETATLHHTEPHSCRYGDDLPIARDIAGFARATENCKVPAVPAVHGTVSRTGVLVR